MPYYIQENHPECGSDAWSVVKADGELIACHSSKESAINQAVAISLDEGEEFLGERTTRELPENYRPALSPDVPEGRACGNCFFYDDDRVSPDGTKAWCNRWQDFVDGGFYCNAWRSDDDDDDMDDETRQVNLEPPAYFRASARRGLEWYEAGLGGDGLVDRTITEARAMSRGIITADKWVRLRAWIARHLVDMDAAANPGDDNYPTPGQVAMALWGGGSNRRTAQRALEYANSVVDKLEQENQGRTGAGLTKLETRLLSETIEIREDGDNMTLTGYAALFNSWSEDLGGFREQIAPGAFRRSLKSRNDVKLLWNHESGEVLGSTRAGTLQLSEDERGLRVEATLPNTQRGRDASVLISRGDVTGFSFGFSIPERGGDSWNQEGTERTLKSVRLFEISLTAFPAYTQTNGTAAVRGLDKAAQRADVDADALADAMLKLETGEDLTSDQAELLTRVVGSLAPQAEPTEEPKPDLAMLALKKKRLELLEKGI